jgi:hypothetical protein
MAKTSNSFTQKVEIDKPATTEERKTKVFVKSGWPKTPKEAVKVVVNFILNFLG